MGEGSEKYHLDAKLLEFPTCFMGTGGLSWKTQEAWGPYLQATGSPDERGLALTSV